jgi:hemoglobin-like flavoprotein
MLTEKQIKLIKQNWSELRGVDPALIGEVFYRKLFIDAPSVKRLFKGGQEEQAIKLIEMLNILVARLERLDELTEDIKQLAVRHVQYGTKPEHYQYVGNTLIWTLKQASRDTWNSELEDAWISCYTLLSSTMIDASK